MIEPSVKRCFRKISYSFISYRSLCRRVHHRQVQRTQLDGHDGRSLNTTTCRQLAVHQQVATSQSIVNNKVGHSAPLGSALRKINRSIVGHDAINRGAQRSQLYTSIAGALTRLNNATAIQSRRYSDPDNISQAKPGFSWSQTRCLTPNSENRSYSSSSSFLNDFLCCLMRETFVDIVRNANNTLIRDLNFP